MQLKFSTFNERYSENSLCGMREGISESKRSKKKK